VRTGSDSFNAEPSDPRLLPLYPGAAECVRCGWCCKVHSCGAAPFDREKGQCSALVSSEDGTYSCGKFDEITSLPKEVWWSAPAFGAGCCSAANGDRLRLLRQGEAEARRRHLQGSVSSTRRLHERDFERGPDGSCLLRGSGDSQEDGSG